MKCEFLFFKVLPKVLIPNAKLRTTDSMGKINRKYIEKNFFAFRGLLYMLKFKNDPEGISTLF